MGDKIYFKSDRSGEFNLFSYDVASKNIVQLTDFKDFPVIDLAAGADEVIFEQAGYLHTYTPANGKVNKLTVGIATDLLELRPRFVKGDQYIRSASISPTGARVVMDFRGEIVTVPAEKGDVVNITSSPGVHETYPAWSPDGKSIAYFSDESGEYELFIHDQGEQQKPKKFKLGGTGFYAHPAWSKITSSASAARSTTGKSLKSVSCTMFLEATS